LSAAVPRLDALGVELRVLERDPRIVRIFVEAVDAAAVVVAGAEAHARHADPDDPRVVFVDTRQSGPFLLPIGTATLVFKPSDAVLQIAEAAQVVLRPAVEAWLDRCGDAWLVAHLHERLAGRTVWARVAAAGTFVRLQEPAGTGGLREVAHRLVTGAVVGSLAEPREWARSLTPSEVERLGELAVAVAAGLHRSIGATARRAAAGDPGWLAEGLALCHRRDDLESVALLLSEAAAGASVRRAAVDLDAAGTRFVRAHRMVFAADQRLRRVAVAHPDAWWAAPVDV
jgi:hypothetical protein